MLVYMLLNTATDMVYVGQTTTTLKKRIDRHRKRGGRSSKNRRLWNALNDFPWHVWEVVVLEECLTLEELGLCETQRCTFGAPRFPGLDDAEERWIATCNSLEPNVGYNVQKRVSGRPKTYENTNEKRRGAGKKAANRKNKATHEQLSEWGKMGVRKKDDMTAEERERFREWGRKGAQKAIENKKLRETIIV